ncbi:MAG: hypothetical protein K9H49_17520 [Bacteroidales bacterium]|nr:hypothetical protein [Bacteroidales bacterium]MCF8391101.1 hypothetical protein [Bacteroidales bacterium]
MKAIRKVILFIIAIIAAFSCEKLGREVYSNEDGRYVRFSLMVDNSGSLVSDGVIEPGAELATTYNQKSIQSLAIPVTISSEALKEEVKLNFSTSATGSYSSFKISPDSILSFNGTQLTDTIYLEYTERWDANEENSIHFKLEDISDTSIHIGNLNSLEKNDELTVNLKELYLRYSLPAANSVEILGEKGEQVEIVVSFPDGLFVSDFDTITLLKTVYSEIDFTIEQMDFNETSNEIVYLLTLNQDIDNDLLSFRAVFSLALLENYVNIGNTSFTITKPEFVPRDNNLNTAADFYNLKDALYRTYGETWLDYNNDDTCDWTAFNAFTFPVVVAANHPNAILYDDMGTEDLDDDIYHHAFRIGFNSPNIGRTTNSFNLKRWFENEYTDADYSPGFNIAQALEFFPDEGTSATAGRVMVVPQDIVISAKVSRDPDVFNTYTISIAGEGEYMEISDGIFEISLAFEATNIQLFGGTRTVYYKIFNTSEYADPLARTDGCFKPMDM